MSSLTFVILFDYSIRIDTIGMVVSILYFKMLPVKQILNGVFLFRKIVFILTNSTDLDEMPHLIWALIVAYGALGSKVFSTGNKSSDVCEKLYISKSNVSMSISFFNICLLLVCVYKTADAGRRLSEGDGINFPRRTLSKSQMARCVSSILV